MAPRIDWDSHIETWQGSGLSQAAYCRLHRLGLSSFSAKVRARRAAPAAKVRAGDAWVLRTISGHVLELPTSVAPGWVAELLRCLG